MKKHTYKLLTALIILAVSCKVPYQPPPSSTSVSYLVVEGTINDNNGSTDSTIITLSRTSKLTASDAVVAELHAQVSVEDGQGFTFALKETGKGNYSAGPMGLDNTKQYRLRIITSDKKVYLSDLTNATYTPPIDSIGVTVTNNYQVAIYANTHNPANNTRNYRWDFTETWEFRARYQSFYMTNGKAIVPRPDSDQYPVRCWQNDASTNIILASSAKLVNDVIYQAPITYVTGSSDKLSVRYSILLKQYGLSTDAFTFWQQTQKNTEQLGSIFDAQPSQLNGNIHCTSNPTEQVFGYISITNIQTKRVYIDRGSLPTTFIAMDITNCSTDSVLYGGPPPINVAIQLLPYPSPPQIPLSPIYSPSGAISGFISTGEACVDCSLSGSKVAPSFWVE